jgi:hypothetical protein
MSFTQQIIILIADKLLIAFVIVIAGFIINKKLKVFEQELISSLKRHEIQFDSLHGKRTENLPQLYSRLEQLKSLSSSFVDDLERRGIYNLTDKTLEPKANMES